MTTLERTWLKAATHKELRGAIRDRDRQLAKLEEKAKPVTSGNVFHAFTGLAQQLDEKAKRLNGLVGLIQGLRVVVPGDGDALRVVEDSIRELKEGCERLETMAWGHARSYAHTEKNRELADVIVESHLERMARRAVSGGKSKEAAA